MEVSGQIYAPACLTRVLALGTLCTGGWVCSGTSLNNVRVKLAINLSSDKSGFRISARNFWLLLRWRQSHFPERIGARMLCFHQTMNDVCEQYM